MVSGNSGDLASPPTSLRTTAFIHMYHKHFRLFEYMQYSYLSPHEYWPSEAIIVMLTSRLHA